MSAPKAADFDALAAALARLLKSAWERQQAELAAAPRSEPARPIERRDE
jgi:hypothetical protein